MPCHGDVDDDDDDALMQRLLLLLLRSGASLGIAWWVADNAGGFLVNVAGLWQAVVRLMNLFWRRRRARHCCHVM